MSAVEQALRNWILQNRHMVDFSLQGAMQYTKAARADAERGLAALVADGTVLRMHEPLCPTCLEDAMDEGGGEYSCPRCGAEFTEPVVEVRYRPVRQV